MCTLHAFQIYKLKPGWEVGKPMKWLVLNLRNTSIKLKPALEVGYPMILKWLVLNLGNTSIKLKTGFWELPETSECVGDGRFGSEGRLVPSLLSVFHRVNVRSCPPPVQRQREECSWHHLFPQPLKHLYGYVRKMQSQHIIRPCPFYALVMFLGFFFKMIVLMNLVSAGDASHILADPDTGRPGYRAEGVECVGSCSSSQV